LKSVLNVFVLLAAFLLIGSQVCATPPAAVEVGQTGVSVYEIKREMERIYDQYANYHGETPRERKLEIRDIAVGNLVEQALKVEYARDQNLPVPAQEIDEKMASIRSQHASDEEFQKALGKETVEDLRASIAKELIAKAAEEFAIDSKLGYTDQDIADFYAQNGFMYQEPMSYRISQIYIKVDPQQSIEEREELQVKAQILAERARKGEDFYDLAYYNSDEEDKKFVGGDLGYFYSGKGQKEIEDAISKMEIGDIAGPIESKFGFHVIKLTDLRPARTLPLEEVRENIKEMLISSKRKTLYDLWINALKEQYPVTYIHPDLKDTASKE